MTSKLKNKFCLPNHIIPFKNPDKEFQELPTNDLFFIPHSSRVIWYGGPSTGKTTAILNAVLHQNFDRIIVVHNDINSREYEHIDCTYYDEIPDPNDEELALDPSQKNLIIFEDLFYKALPSQQKKWLTDYFTTFSTHRSISCYLTCQDLFHQVPTNIRRCCNVFVIFKNIDMNNLRNICAVLNLDYKDIKFVFEKYLTSNYDNLIIDLNRPSQKLRKNFIQVLDI